MVNANRNFRSPPPEELFAIPFTSGRGGALPIHLPDFVRGLLQSSWVVTQISYAILLMSPDGFLRLSPGPPQLVLLLTISLDMKMDGAPGYRLPVLERLALQKHPPRSRSTITAPCFCVPFQRALQKASNRLFECRCAYPQCGVLAVQNKVDDLARNLLRL